MQGVFKHKFWMDKDSLGVDCKKSPTEVIQIIGMKKMSVEIRMPNFCIDWWDLIKVAKNHKRTYMGTKINKKLEKAGK